MLCSLHALECKYTRENYVTADKNLFKRESDPSSSCLTGYDDDGIFKGFSSRSPQAFFPHILNRKQVAGENETFFSLFLKE